MRIQLPFDEALAFARSRGPLPDIVQSIGCEGSTISIELDLRTVESSSLGMRIALAAAGAVLVSVRVADYSEGIVSLAVTAHARGLPAHKLLPYLLRPIDDAVVKAGLPSGTVTVADTDGDPIIRVDVQRAVETRVEGMTITALHLTDAVMQLSADVGDFRVL